MKCLESLRRQIQTSKAKKGTIKIAVTITRFQKSGPGYNCIFINKVEAVHRMKAAKTTINILIHYPFGRWIETALTYAAE